jgi:hypothetical protein
MREKLFALTTLACALAVLLSGGCEPAVYDAPVRQAIIRIGDTNPARSLMPTDAPVFTKYELVFTADGKDDIYRSLETSGDRAAITGNGYAIDLEEASWTVEASAFVSGTGGIFRKAARGSSSLTISGASNPPVNIQLTTLDMDGEARGILAWNLTVSGVTGSIRVEGIITRVVDGVPDDGTYLPAGLSGSKELASGYYHLQFTLSKESKSAGVSRAVHIYPGLTTKAEGADFTFTNDDFAEQKYLKGTATISDVPDSRPIEWVKVQPYQDPDFAIPLPDAASPFNPQPDAAATVAPDNTWFLSIPGSVSDVYFRLKMKLNSPDEEYNFNAGMATRVPAEGQMGINLSAVWSPNRYTVSYTVGTGGGGTPPPSVQKVSGDRIYLPGQSGAGYAMTPPNNRTLIGWRIGTQNYSVGDEINITGNTVCEARWGLRGPLSPKPTRADGLQIPLAKFHSVNFPDFPNDHYGNTYVVWAGTLENVYLKELARAQNTGGSFDITLTDSQMTETSLTQGTSSTTSLSVSESMKLSIGSELGGEAFGATVKTSLEISLGINQTWTNTHSVSNTSTTAQTSTIERNYAHPFTADDPASGFYRYALYANKCDVYFVFTTSADKQRLLDMKTSVCARASDGFGVYLEYSADGNFDIQAPAPATLLETKNPDGSPIWQRRSDPDNLPTDPISIHIDDGGAREMKKNDGHQHTGYRPVGLQISALRSLGYNYIKISMDVTTKAHKQAGSNGRDIWLDIDGSQVWGSSINVTLVEEPQTLTATIIPITSFTDTSTVRFGFEQTGVAGDNGKWWFYRSDITFTPLKNL